MNLYLGNFENSQSLNESKSQLTNRISVLERNQFSGLIEGYQEKHVSSEHPNVVKDG